jgi:hypothetical protein
MVELEQVEKLRERTGISYEEAKKALEEADGDLLEALIRLERKNLIKAPEADGYYSSKGEKQESSDQNQNTYKDTKPNNGGTRLSEMFGEFFKWCGKVFHKGNTNSFKVIKDGTTVMLIPLTVLALCLIFCFWVTIPLIFIGLVFGYRYRFSGPDLDRTDINKSVETVSDATLRAVNKVVDAAGNLSKDAKKNKGDNACEEDTCN